MSTNAHILSLLQNKNIFKYPGGESSKFKKLNQATVFSFSV